MAAKVAASKKGSVGRLRVKLTRGWAGKAIRQVATLRGLGLRRSGDVNELPDNASVRGAVDKVSHLVTVEKIG
jgi:large subunit ribosomal protein L30